MGMGVTAQQTFSNQLEDMLKEKYREINYQIINAGVQGYMTLQEYNILRRSLVFSPDFVAIGFCMNDVMEFIKYYQQHGGGRPSDFGYMFTYFILETGYGNLALKVSRLSMSIEKMVQDELNSVKHIAINSASGPGFSDIWKMVLSYLEKSYNLSREHNIRVVLLIFPHTVQLGNSELQEPQRILNRHAEEQEVDVIDFTVVFEDIIFDKEVSGLLAEKGFSENEVNDLYKSRVRNYFIDNDHLTVEGHRIVASKLYEYLLNHYVFASQHE
jgi:lysophospholipase L1-like esterase